VDWVIFDGGGAGAFADGCVQAQMGTVGVAATPHMRDRLAGRRPGVMFVDAPTAGSKGPAQQEQLLIPSRQVRFREDDGRRRAGAGR
jgi:3-hydroxyisobutyrate dehydrogenase